MKNKRAYVHEEDVDDLLAPNQDTNTPAFQDAISNVKAFIETIKEETGKDHISFEEFFRYLATSVDNDYSLYKASFPNMGKAYELAGFGPSNWKEVYDNYFTDVKKVSTDNNKKEEDEVLKPKETKKTLKQKIIDGLYVIAFFGGIAIIFYFFVSFNDLINFLISFGTIIVLASIPLLFLLACRRDDRLYNSYAIKYLRIKKENWIGNSESSATIFMGPMLLVIGIIMLYHAMTFIIMILNNSYYVLVGVAFIFSCYLWFNKNWNKKYDKGSMLLLKLVFPIMLILFFIISYPYRYIIQININHDLIYSIESFFLG